MHFLATWEVSLDINKFKFERRRRCQIPIPALGSAINIQTGRPPIRPSTPSLPLSQILQIRRLPGVFPWHIRFSFYVGATLPMPTHKFRIGQLVQLAPAISRNVPGGSYEVTRQLPESSGEFEYRIKSVNEPHERVESELRGV
jgi:hypothetical protein